MYVLALLCINHFDNSRDENGELYLKDTREHTKIITCYKKLV